MVNLTSNLSLKEKQINESVRRRIETNLKSRYFDSWRDQSSQSEKNNQKFNQFYAKNLKMKAFYTLIKYAKSKIALKNKQKMNQKLDKYLQQKYFKKWRQLYSHKMNQLGNRK